MHSFKIYVSYVYIKKEEGEDIEVFQTFNFKLHLDFGLIFLGGECYRLSETLFLDLLYMFTLAINAKHFMGSTLISWW